MTWYYIWYMLHKIPAYERTCGTKEAADERVSKLRSQGKEAWWTTTVFKHFWY